MPEDKNVPPKPTAGSSEAPTGAGHIDLDKVLLPKKQVPGATIDSAERINAGALLEQEQNATLIPPKPAAPPTPPPQPKQPDGPMVPPLQTFKGDIEGLIQSTNASTVSIAAAEAARRAQTPLETPEEARPFDWGSFAKRSGMVFAGLLFLAIAGGILYFAYTFLNATVPVAEDEPSPFITVDGTEAVALPPGVITRQPIMTALESAHQSEPLSLGLIERLAVYQTVVGEESDSYLPLDASALLTALVPTLPDELVRTLTGRYLLGVHTYDGLQALLLIEVDSYEHGFAGMLEWERTMRNDLLPLFGYEPRERIPEEGIATSSVGGVPQLLQTGFSDKIIANRDTRAILNTSGDVMLLWTQLTPNLFVVTTNEYTLREIISRLGL